MSAKADAGERGMGANDGVIVVVSRTAADAENLKNLIEFMDEPEVCTSTPGDWRRTIGEKRLDAIFVGADLSDGEVRSLVDDVGTMDPNVQIVMMHGTDSQ